MLKELRITLEEERGAERDRLEAQRRRDIERLQEESEGELQAEKRRLQGEREEKLTSLKHEVNEDDAGPLVARSFLISILCSHSNVCCCTCLETTLLYAS